MGNIATKFAFPPKNLYTAVSLQGRSTYEFAKDWRTKHGKAKTKSKSVYARLVSLGIDTALEKFYWKLLDMEMQSSWMEGAAIVQAKETLLLVPMSASAIRLTDAIAVVFGFLAELDHSSIGVPCGMYSEDAESGEAHMHSYPKLTTNQHELRFVIGYTEARATDDPTDRVRAHTAVRGLATPAEIREHQAAYANAFDEDDDFDEGYPAPKPSKKVPEKAPPALNRFPDEPEGGYYSYMLDSMEVNKYARALLAEGVDYEKALFHVRDALLHEEDTVLVLPTQIGIEYLRPLLLRDTVLPFCRLEQQEVKYSLRPSFKAKVVKYSKANIVINSEGPYSGARLLLATPEDLTAMQFRYSQGYKNVVWAGTLLTPPNTVRKFLRSVIPNKEHLSQAIAAQLDAKRADVILLFDKSDRIGTSFRKYLRTTLRACLQDYHPFNWAEGKLYTENNAVLRFVEYRVGNTFRRLYYTNDADFAVDEFMPYREKVDIADLREQGMLTWR